MWGTVGFCLLLVVPLMAKPFPDARLGPLVETWARMYSFIHPNKALVADPEHGDYFEGDILIPENQDPIAESNPLNAVTNPNLLWPAATLYYTIQNGAYTPDQIDAIEYGIFDLMELTKVNGELCVHIVPRTTETNYVSVQNFDGCSSFVGMVGGSQRLSLVDSCIPNRHGTIMHEFLHAFGFYHEQSRYDRDDWIFVNFDNIQEGRANNFAMRPPGQIDLLGTSYDYGSAMHYGAYGFAIDPTIPTIIPHDPDAEIGQRVTLSALDIERVQILYKCLDPADSVHFKHLANHD